MFYTEWQHKFHVNTSFFSRNLCSLKNYENHGTCRQAGRDVKWRKGQLGCASQLTETKDNRYWVIMLNCLYIGIWNFIYTQRVYIYIYIYISLYVLANNIYLLVENKRATWCHLLFLFHFLCALHVSDFNISIIRSLWLFCWICYILQHGYDANPTTPKHRHTSDQEQTTNVVIQQNVHKLLMMDTLM